MSGAEEKEVGRAGVWGAILLAAAPVLIYFLGWTYLNYYLEIFGVGVAELDIGVETVFIYAAPAALWFIKNIWLWLSISAVVLLLLGSRRWCGSLVKRPAKHAGTTPRLPALNGYVQGALAVLIVSVGLTVIVKGIPPYVKKAAHQGAARAWDYAGIKIEVATISSQSNPAAWQQNFDACKRRRRLQLIFADKSAYYVLCPSEIDTHGSIFEVRREDSHLASVRYVTRPETKE